MLVFLATEFTKFLHADLISLALGCEDARVRPQARLPTEKAVTQRLNAAALRATRFTRWMDCIVREAEPFPLWSSWSAPELPEKRRGARYLSDAGSRH
jgi:hypothetical protein